jgi:hypothetical protein
MSFTFYLGTHETSWLGLTSVPLFISRRRLALRKACPRALGPWALDSGGFTELSMFGAWKTTATEYVAEVRRWMSEIGQMRWAAAQDWMCEEFILAKTGKTVADHQRLTIENYLELRSLAPEIPWLPVLQGWTAGDYYEHAQAYDKAGVDLRKLPAVGLGSVCRRQHLLRILILIRDLASEGLRLHGFGFKTLGLKEAHHHLASADSLSWSYDARRNQRMPGHTHKNCANCLEYALDWRERLLSGLGRNVQGFLEVA